MIHQGRAYDDPSFFGRVIALETVESGMVKVLIRLDTPYPRVDFTDAEFLHPAPMRYHGNEIPS